MSLPLFYTTGLSSSTLTLNEDTSKHIIGVLRMTVGEQVLLTDGKGAKATATITDGNRKRCTVQLQQIENETQQTPHISVAISIIKNAARFEWFLEKATEIGVNEIIPLLCERTEKEKFRFDRMQGILISAMLQSQQSWLPVLQQPMSFAAVIKHSTASSKFIAHCLPEQKQSLAQRIPSNISISQYPNSSLILIGPEGDFTPAEIELALANEFQPVALGATRLRTETAGVVAATLLRMAMGDEL